MITFGGADFDRGHAILPTKNGGYIVVGQTTSFGQGSIDVYVAKLDPIGNIEWTRTIGGSNEDGGYAIVQTVDNGYAIAGYTMSFGQGNYDMYVIKLDNNGNVQWSKTIGGTNIDYARAILQTPDKGFLVVGYTNSYGQGNLDVYIVKLDSIGNLQWDKTIGGIYNDFSRDVIQTSDGGYAIVGYTYSFGQGWSDVYVIKIDSIGNIQWTRTIGGADIDRGHAIVQTIDNGYAIVGQTASYGQGNEDVYVIKLNSAGEVLWTKTIGGINEDRGFDIVQGSDGSLTLVGWTTSFGQGSYDVYIVQLDSVGSLQWTTTIGGTMGDYGYGIAVVSDSSYILTGWSSSFAVGVTDVMVLQINNHGYIQVGNCGGVVTGVGLVSMGGDTLSGGLSTLGGGAIATGGDTLSGAMLNQCVPLNPCVNFSVNIDSSSLPVLSAIPSGGTPPYTYLWNTGSNTDTIVVPNSGTYWVKVTDAYGCIAYDTIHVVIVSKPQPFIPIIQWRLINCNELWIKAPNENLTFEVLTLEGKQLKKATLIGNGWHLAARLPAKGIYLLRYKLQGNTIIQKIIALP